MKREYGRLDHDFGRLRWSVLLESSAHECICSCNKGEEERLSCGRRSEARRTENGTDGMGQRRQLATQMPECTPERKGGMHPLISSDPVLFLPSHASPSYPGQG
ncbi:uncharacterized protein CLUP02_10295 [Colletotrichum lupini]|uniref:Uncharacterized protein n=1 Tax=Colletotrichum lupini TaxID=145971 RepID=A0A9Q8SWG4_9PEZI|nr:uncharacterized protein CLUP02_10295 [Colletotrichum lupini]UQC84799.1 hypothetical protein CLUP02_10295 [Colletotrichum lupini]